MPVQVPTECPECGHALLAPEMHAVCPECAFEYDEHTEVWRPKRPWQIYAAFANVAIFLPFLFRCLQVILMYKQRPSNGLLVAAAMAIAALLWAMPRLRVLLSEGHRFAALTPRGVQARTPREAYLIPWSQLGEIDVQFGNPRLQRLGHPEPCNLEWIFESDAEVEQFIERLNEARARYAPDPPHQSANA